MKKLCTFLLVLFLFITPVMGDSLPDNITADISDDQVLLTWEAPENHEDIEGYNVYQKYETENEDEYIETLLGDELITELQFIDETAERENIYIYRVTSVDFDGNESEFSADVEFYFPKFIVPIQNLVAEIDDGKVTLTWDHIVTDIDTLDSDKEEPGELRFQVNRNGEELDNITSKSFEDLDPPKEKLIYTVRVFSGIDFSEKAMIEVDLEEKIPERSINYIGAKSTKKFHETDCRYVKKIKPENKAYFYTRTEAISKGYIPCKVCKP